MQRVYVCLVRMCNVQGSSGVCPRLNLALLPGLLRASKRNVFFFFSVFVLGEFLKFPASFDHETASRKS